MPICEGGRSKTVNETNKVATVHMCEDLLCLNCCLLFPPLPSQSDYVNLLSQFKLEVSIKEELEAFTTGFWKAREYFKIVVFINSILYKLI